MRHKIFAVLFGAILGLTLHPLAPVAEHYAPDIASALSDLSPISSAYADNYYAFDGTNDEMEGSFTSTYAKPVTLAAWVWYADHPIAFTHIIDFGNSSSSANDSLACRTTNTDNEIAATSIDSSNGTTSAFATKTGIDGTWVPVICEFISNSSRAIFFSDQTGTNGGSRTVADVLQFVSVGTNLANGQDFIGRLAYVSIWDVQLSDSDETAFLSGTCPSTIDSSNLIGYWDLQSSGSTQNNAGVDAGGDLTVANATFNSGGGPGISCGSPPTFVSAPACVPTTNGVSCPYTASAASTLYGVGVALADGTPTCPQIIAGNNDGGTAAIVSGSDANSGSADTIVITGTNKPPKLNYHFCLTNGGGNSSVDSSQSGELRSPRSGYALVTMASHSSTGICNEDAYFNPDCRDGVVIEFEDDTDEDSDCNADISTAGEISLTPTGAGVCGPARRSFNLSYEYDGSATTGCFTAPTAGCFSSDDTVYVNNPGPVCNQEPENEIVVLTEDASMTARDLNDLGGCSHAEGDVLSYAVTGGSLPTGTSLSGTGNKNWTGTPSTENEAGTLVTVTVTDIVGDTTTFQFTVYVINTWTVPNCVTNTASECSVEILAAAPWRGEDPNLNVSSLVCDWSNPDKITSQSPTAGSQATAFQDIEVVLTYIPNMPDLIGLSEAAAIAIIEALCP